jgi:hypothetical protein
VRSDIPFNGRHFLRCPCKASILSIAVNVHILPRRQACDKSLQDLNIDTIDLYYQHRVDPNVAIETSVATMAVRRHHLASHFRQRRTRALLGGLTIGSAQLLGACASRVAVMPGYAFDRRSAVPTKAAARRSW